MTPPPVRLDLKKDRGLTVEWADGETSYYSVAYLRRMSPSADQRQLREEQEKNPLAVLPSSFGSGEAVRAESAELVGNYAVRIRFSDGHDTGIYSWAYLRELWEREAEGRRQKAEGGEGSDAGGAGVG